ncbi:M17 family peptidase N-terminal domain-containing protein [Novosphingobium sp.]|jgi:hypothetical protein|uniref:M17 family peptidase N-terminal domain-containing protein n=1 Tax=Novosphingobium sp. TaxID=1874826 RepID=UPI002FE1B2CE
MIPPHPVGSAFGVSIEVAAWDAVGAEVDLSCAGMFTREVGAELSGGLAHLDAALEGRLLELRRSGSFTGRLGECLLLDSPPAAIRARAVLLVGLGEPEGWSTASLREALRAAGAFALALGVRSAAFAPGMLDSGLAPDQTLGAPTEMTGGLAAALKARDVLVKMGLAEAPRLERWVFDVGEARLTSATEQFRKALAAT